MEKEHRMESKQAAQLNAEYKQKFKELTEQLGRVPDTKDPEYWLLTDWHKEQFDTERAKRVKVEAIERAAEKRQAEMPVRVTENLCKKCGEIIPPSGKRGRPALTCADCRNKKGKK
jgi:RNA polymerase-binding transcription factor DksA